MGLAPGEKGGIVDQAIFDHFGIARAKLALVERVEQRRVGDDQGRHVEAADQIFLAGGVDRGLAADRAVDLGKQSGGDVDHRAAALEQRGGKTGHVADRAPAEREDRGAAPDIACGEAVDDRCQHVPILCGFAFGDEDGWLKRDRGQFGAMQGQHAWIGDEREWLAIGERCDPVERLGQVADQYFTRGVAVADRDADHRDKC